MKILVIDDEKPTLSMFRLFLTAYGYEVFTAENGEQGLALFEKIRPDIVFTDIRMPGMDGLTVLDRIRRQSTRTQVIIITGHGDMEKAVQAMDLDASDFINKPVARKALNAALVRAEKRTRQDPAQAFSTEVRAEYPVLALTLKGKLSQGADLAALDPDFCPQGVKEAELCLDPGFAIDRQGISALMDRLQAIRDQGIQIRITGLSYNYLRFFEMAGMNKLARLYAEPAEEPEF